MDLLAARRVPYMARRNFVIELRHLVVWGVFAGLIEGTVSGVIVAKTFAASDLLITVVTATPAFANLVSLMWGALLVRRRKLPLLLALGAACVACILSVAFTPATRWGGWLFAFQILLSRVFMSGVVTTRAAIWRTNYPRSHRGRITARLQIVRTLGSIPLILGCGLLFDLHPHAYSWFYPLVGALGALGLLMIRRLRVRGERIHDAPRARNDDPEDMADDLSERFSLPALIRPWEVVARMRRALAADPRFARYCAAQMCIGSANLMVINVNVIVLTKVLLLGYAASNSLIDIVPRVVMLATLPMWARLFDRVGVLRFRVFNSACWSGSLILCGLGTLLASGGSAGHHRLFAIACGAYVLGRVIDGLAQSGGAIAWNIGHLHFAEDDKAELYMGIHVSLTGLRGLSAPFIGLALYKLIGWGVFVVALGLALTGLRLFARLAREERRLAASQAEKLEDRAGARNGVGQPADLLRR